MFPKSHRLPLRGSQKFFQTARSVHTRALSLHWMPSTEPSSRAAIVIKKTTAPLSSQRSALKRRLRAAILTKLTSSTKNKDIVFIYKGKKNASYSEILEDVEKIFSMVRD